MNTRVLIERMAELHGSGREWLTSRDLDDGLPRRPSTMLNDLWQRGLVWRRATDKNRKGHSRYEYRLAQQAEPILIEGAAIY
jgi:predicted transcriptional regulator